jgi:hypothetical protein
MNIGMDIRRSTHPLPLPINQFPYRTVGINFRLLQSIEIDGSGTMGPDYHYWCLEKPIAITEDTNYGFSTNVTTGTGRTLGRAQFVLDQNDILADSVHYPCQEVINPVSPCTVLFRQAKGTSFTNERTHATRLKKGFQTKIKTIESRQCKNL